MLIINHLNEYKKKRKIGPVLHHAPSDIKATLVMYDSNDRLYHAPSDIKATLVMYDSNDRLYHAPSDIKATLAMYDSNDRLSYEVDLYDDGAMRTIPVKNYRHGIADLFGVILPNRRRSVHFMGVTRPRNRRGRPFLDYNFIYICIRTIYTYVTVMKWVNNCESPIVHIQWYMN